MHMIIVQVSVIMIALGRNLLCLVRQLYITTYGLYESLTTITCRIMQHVNVHFANESSIVLCCCYWFPIEITVFF